MLTLVQPLNAFSSLSKQQRLNILSVCSEVPHGNVESWLAEQYGHEVTDVHGVNMVVEFCDSHAINSGQIEVI